MDPFSLRRPVDVSRRQLRLSDESDASITEIGEADGVPGPLRIWFLAMDEGGDVVCCRRHHGFDHESRFGHADRTAVLPNGGMATQTPTEKMFGNAGFCWCFVCEDEAAGIGQALNARMADTPRNAGSIIV